MFRPKFGICSCCGKPGLVVVKSGLIKQCNDQLKKSKKIEKPKSEKKVNKSNAFHPHNGNCSCCGKPGLIVKKSDIRHQCNEQKKKEEKSRRVVNLINKAEKNVSYPQLKKRLWEIFSEYIRLRDSKDGWFTCISCGKHQSASGGNLQAGHYYKSENYSSLRYHPCNVNAQCRLCNIRLEGNRQGYEIGMIKKYGQATVDMLKLTCHNKVNLGRFELELLIKEFTQKLNDLKAGIK